MYLVHLFGTSPVVGLSVFVCVATILWCIFMMRRQQSGPDRILMGVIGFISVYQGLKILKSAGIFSLTLLTGRVDDLADLSIASMYLIAALILKLSAADRATTKLRLRLVEANETPLALTRGASGGADLPACLVEAAPLAMFTVDGNGTVIQWNASAERVFGWKRDELLGRPLPFPLQAGEGRLSGKVGGPFDATVWLAPLTTAAGAARGQLAIVAAAGAQFAPQEAVGTTTQPLAQPRVRWA
jgi:PAS domain-containing protein